MCKPPGKNIKVKMLYCQESGKDDFITSSFDTDYGKTYIYFFYKDYNNIQSICNYKSVNSGSFSIAPKDNDYSEYEGIVHKLDSAAKSKWTFKISERQLECFNSETGRQVLIKIGSMIPDSKISFATHLPDDKVIFQFGKNQIYVYDPVAKKLALFARGRGPIAVLDEKKQ